MNSRPIAALFFNELARLSGDQGGRALFERFPERLIYLDLPSREIHTDLDTPEDHSRFLTDLSGSP